MNEKPAYYHFILFIIIYFFLNNAFLPHGLLYTTLLAPVFLYWLYKKKQWPVLLKWSVLLVIPIPFQLLAGIDFRTYLVSTILVITAWVFLFTALEGVRTFKVHLENIFYKVLLVNFILLVVALIILPLSPIRDLMWDSEPMSSNLSSFPRLKLLAYEPSHYALLLSPVFLFFILKVILGQADHPLVLAGGILAPLVLSFSFGVIGAIILAMAASMFINFRFLPRNARRIVIYSSGFLILFALALWLFWPENLLFLRIKNILTGADSSAKGRLAHSFMFAKDLIIQHRAWLGVGPGQVKILAHDLIVNYYHYSGHYAEVVRIPNSMGEMLATYGLYGFVLKIFFEIYFFIRLKIYRNLYSFLLFLFLFIYQFTGSFLVNAAEIGTWAIVYISRFKNFELDHLMASKT